jgi:hypothetical protein
MCDGGWQIRHTRLMQSASIRKLLLALTLLAVILGTIVHFYNQNAQKTENLTRIILEPHDYFSYHQPETSASKKQKQTGSDASDSQKTLRQKVEEWLALHHRSATSLLAAYHVLDDTNYLRVAATNFPNDPQVELAVLARNVFPEDRRKWLDLFKASSPSNSLANYLSAQTYFQNGQSEAAVKDLVAATGKPQFENYTLESQLNAEELGLFCGESPLKSTETALASSAGDTALTTLKQLASQMTDLQKQELNVGDNNSAENLAQMGAILGSQLNSGASGNYIINQLAGMAVESMMLDQLDPNISYDFLDGETPGQKLQDLKQQKAMLSQLATDFSAIEPNLTDAEKVSFEERKKIYGEVAAMRWLLQQHGNPQSGQ